jgi:O-antigen/teichoic acid export membrane protein
MRPRLRALWSAHGAYYAAMAVAGGFGLLKSVGYGLVLVPSEFGRLSLMTSLVPFVLLGLSRGLLEGAAIELPGLYGRKREGAAAALVRRSMRRLFVECLVALGVALVLLAAGAPVGMLSLAIAMAASTGVLSLVMTDLRSRGEMGRYGVSVLLRVLVCTLLGLPAAALFGLPGAVLGEVAAQGLLILWLLRFVATAHEAAPELPAMAARGRWMMLHQLLQLVQQNGDKWIITFALGAAALGQYSFAGIFLVAVALLHAIVYQQVGPAALRSLAAGEAAAVVLRRVQRWSLATGAGVAVLGAGAGVVYWLAREGPAAAYAEGFRIFPWVVAAGVLQAMNHLDWIVSAGPWLSRLARWDFFVAAGLFAAGLAGVLWDWPLAYYAAVACGVRAAALLVAYGLARSTVREFRAP